MSDITIPPVRAEPDPDLVEETKKSELSALVELFELDGSQARNEKGEIEPFNDDDGIIRFCSNTQAKGPLYYAGNEFTPWPVTASGFDWDGQGPLPRPTLDIGDVEGLLFFLARRYDDFIGLKVTRIKTYARFLGTKDDKAGNVLAKYPDEIYYVERKIRQTKLGLVFQLASIIDQEGQYLPNRTTQRDICSRRYRYFNAATGRFVEHDTDINGYAQDDHRYDASKVSNVTCPYVNTKYFDTNDTELTKAEDRPKDQCGKRVSSCLLRFRGDPNGLPTYAFPAVGLNRR